MTWASGRPVLAVALLAVQAAGCSGLSTGPGAGPSEVWFGNGAAYRYDFQRLCECLPEVTQPVTITVRGEEVAEVRSLETGRDVAAPEGLPWPTFGDLLEEAERARRAGTPVTIEHGPDRLPRRIEIGTPENDAGVVYLVGGFAAAD